MKQNEVLFLFVSLFILSCAWIAFSIVHSALTSTITDSQAVDISSISPTFDMKTIEMLNKKAVISPDFAIQAQNGTDIVVKQALTSPTPISVVQIATPSSQTASGGAQAK